MLKDVANTGGELIANTLGSGTPTTKPAAVLCAKPCPDHGPAHQQPRRSNRRPRRPRHRRSPDRQQPAPNRSAPSDRYKTEGPCIHHGPDSKHTTAECRDPGLKRSRRRETSTTSTTVTTLVAASSPQDDAMYSPIFVTKISRSSSRFPRASFTPNRRYRSHLSRNHHCAGNGPFTVNNASIELVNNCIATYTRPFRGVYLPARGAPTSSLPHKPRKTALRSARSKRRSRTLNRARRRKNNRRVNYPAGHFKPSHPRKPRTF